MNNYPNSYLDSRGCTDVGRAHVWKVDESGSTGSILELVKDGLYVVIMIVYIIVIYINIRDFDLD